MLILETSNAIGISFFIFAVYPELDFTRSILILNATSLVPSFLKIFIDLINSDGIKFDEKIYEQQNQNFLKLFLLKKFKISKLNWKLILLNLNTLTFLMQLLSIFIFVFTEYCAENQSLKWKIPVAIFLVSLPLSSYYFHLNKVTKRISKSSGLNSIILSIKNFFSNVEQSKHRLGLVTNLWKIGIILLFSHYFYPNYLKNTILFITANPNQNSSVFNQSFPYTRHSERLSFFGAFIVHFVSSLMLYLASSLAFKLRMIRFSFALPLTLVTPILFIISLLICEYGVLNLNTNWLTDFNYNFICEKNSKIQVFAACGLCLWWASHLWVTRHIWAKWKGNSNTTIKR